MSLSDLVPTPCDCNFAKTAPISSGEHLDQDTLLSVIPKTARQRILDRSSESQIVEFLLNTVFEFHVQETFS